MQNIEKNLNRIREQIAQAASACERDPDSVLLLAVSKRKPSSDIRAAFESGQKHFGENYLQEAQQKMQELSDLDICWHFIGAIQSNKTRDIASAFDWAHCIDRIKIARRLSDQRQSDKPPLNVCIQVNIDHEDSKAGIDLNAVPELAAAIQQLSPAFRERLTGLAPLASIDGAEEAFTAHTVDCVNLIALAVAEADSAIPSEFRIRMAPVSGGGRQCTTFSACISLLDQPLQIDYNGLSGDIELSSTTGDPTSGLFETFHFDADGTEIEHRRLEVLPAP